MKKLYWPAQVLLETEVPDDFDVPSIGVGGACPSCEKATVHTMDFVSGQYRCGAGVWHDLPAKFVEIAQDDYTCLVVNTKDLRETARLQGKLSREPLFGVNRG